MRCSSGGSVPVADHELDWPSFDVRMEEVPLSGLRHPTTEITRFT
jgi:hypothetical protein